MRIRKIFLFFFFFSVPLLSVQALPGSLPPSVESHLKKLLKERGVTAPKLSVTQGPLDTHTVLGTPQEMGPPGTPIVRVLLKEGVSYGLHGEKDFAEFARKEGWLKTLPVKSIFFRLLNDAQFEGFLQIEEDKSELSLGKEGLKGILVYRSYPGNQRHQKIIRIPSVGPLQIQEK